MAINQGLTSRRANSIGRLEAFYPSPFFDIAQMYVPDTLKETFDWCLYYQLTNPLVNAVTSKLATYPITELVYKHDNAAVSKMWRNLFEKQFLLRTFLVETNLDRYTFGNSFASVAFPIKKILICSNCKHEKSASKSNYVWRGYKFVITCEKCDTAVEAQVRDEPVKSKKQIKLVRWNPKHITLKTNEITGTTSYYYTIPTILRNHITLGKPEVIETVPQTFIDAIRKKRAIRIHPDKIFHSKRPSASRSPADSGWGTPLILPVLKDIFFLQVLRKSQEAVAMEHIVPMRVMFPQVTTDGSNPYAHINLTDWQKEVMTQISKWRKDFNHISVMPLPIGSQTIGGQGKAYLLHQEVRIYSEQIIAGMGVPTGFFYGEAMYSGASVNLRALENEFLGNIQDMSMLVEFIHDQVAAFLGVAKLEEVQFKPFKMADDLQRAAFESQLATQKVLSKSTFLQTRDHDYEVERGLIERETADENRAMREVTINQAKASGEAQIVATRYQIKAQELMPQPQVGPDGQPVQGAAPQGMEQGVPQEQAPGMSQEGQPMPQEAPTQAMGGQSPMDMGVAQSGGHNVDTQLQIKSSADSLSTLPVSERYQALMALRETNPTMYQLVNAELNARPPGSSLKPLPSISQPAPPVTG